MKKGKEIEKRYLILENGEVFATYEFLKLYETFELLKSDLLHYGREINQGYLPIKQGLSLANDLNWPVYFDVDVARLRIDDDKLYLTLKEKGSIEREELEDEISKDLFDKNWSLTEGKRLRKFRLEKKFGDYIVELDFYFDRSLIIAEIEFPSREKAEKILPLGKDVTENPEYSGIKLAR